MTHTPTDDASRDCLTLVHAWAVTRRDGVVLGFTDHDLPLAFDGITFTPDTGLSARAIVSGTGLAVDNTEVMGALSADAITDADIAAGLYDGAAIRMWQVDWSDPAQRDLRFSGTLGELRRQDGAFHAELRGLSEGLNLPVGRRFQKMCSAVLGDGDCRVDLDDLRYAAEGVVTGFASDGAWLCQGFDGFHDGWFAQGSLFVLLGEKRHSECLIRADRPAGDGLRAIGLWDDPGPRPEIGTAVRLVAGCDKGVESCRVKFANILNFRGFPLIPGEDWLLAASQGAIHE